MIYQNALKLKVGDTVYMQKVDKPITIIGIEVDESAKAVFVRGSNGTTYYHSILTLERPAKAAKKTDSERTDAIAIYQSNRRKPTSFKWWDEFEHLNLFAPPSQ